MAIQFDETTRIFSLETDGSTYQMQADSHGCLLHLYYGAPISGPADYLLTFYDRGFSGTPYDAGKDRTYSLDALPQEFPVQGTGDYRSTCLTVKHPDGSCGCDLRYKRHSILPGKYSLPGLPAVYEENADCSAAVRKHAPEGGDGAPKGSNSGVCNDRRDGGTDAEDNGAIAAGHNGVQTLEIELEDVGGDLSVTLLYGVFPHLDVITRSAVVKNLGVGSISLEAVQSACLDFMGGEYDLIQFYGRHAMERNFQRAPILHGATVIGSRRGTSSHQYNPFVIAAERGAGEDYGSCYGMSFVYSGGFTCTAERDQYDQTRLTMGLSGEQFSWPLEAGGSFTAPEVILSYSGEGLTALSHNYHRTLRRHVCRGKYRDIPRPVLINNWEATYFDFTGDKILEIARQASRLGVEMMVLDDGWFGDRGDDDRGLGDWQVNEKKLGRPLKELVADINGLGMKFGIWMEPEMISEDSGLYRAHPDWAFALPGRKPVRSRCQLVLDFSRPEVVDHIYSQLCLVLDSANIEYVKWDMNRSICDVWSAAGGGFGSGAVLHRYVLGLYGLLERLNRRYPDLLIEGCSGGGGRFDAGMLYYTPQIWCSDNTDAVDRLSIQYGTSFGYPVSAVGAHVSAVPNHQTGRITPMKTRGVTAMAGSFGYELDLSRITKEEKDCVRAQIADFHRYWKLIHDGDYYRLSNPAESGGTSGAAAWAFVSGDKSEALVNLVALECHGNPVNYYVKLKGLDRSALYRDSDSGRIYPGGALMTAGLPVPRPEVEYEAWQIHLCRV